MGIRDVSHFSAPKDEREILDMFEADRRAPHSQDVCRLAYRQDIEALAKDRFKKEKQQ